MMCERIEQIKKYLSQCAVLRTEPQLGTADCKYLIDKIAELEAERDEILQSERGRHYMENKALRDQLAAVKALRDEIEALVNIGVKKLMSKTTVELLDKALDSGGDDE